MKIPLKAKIICKDGEFGYIKELLIDPIKEKVTHVVIENKHNGNTVVIPLDIITYTSDMVININLKADEIDKLPKFIKHEFISVPVSDTEYTYWGADPSMIHSYTMFPYVIHEGQPVIEITKESIPEGIQKLKKGLVVKDYNGKKLGRVDELVIDSKSDSITHIVMRTGHIFGSKDVAVPSINIFSYQEDSIILSLNSDEVEILPEVIIKRVWS